MAHASAMAATRIVADDMEARRRDGEAAARDMRESERRSGHSSGGGVRPGVPSFGRGLGDLLSVPDHETARRTRGDSMRLRLYALGDHLKSSDVGTGILVNLSATLSWDAMRAILLNELFGDTIDIAHVDLNLVSLHLLPDGERVRGPGELQSVEFAAPTPASAVPSRRSPVRGRGPSHREQFSCGGAFPTFLARMRTRFAALRSRLLPPRPQSS